MSVRGLGFRVPSLQALEREQTLRSTVEVLENEVVAALLPRRTRLAQVSAHALARFAVVAIGAWVGVAAFARSSAEWRTEEARLLTMVCGAWIASRTLRREYTAGTTTTCPVAPAVRVWLAAGIRHALALPARAHVVVSARVVVVAGLRVVDMHASTLVHVTRVIGADVAVVAANRLLRRARAILAIGWLVVSQPVGTALGLFAKRLVVLVDAPQCAVTRVVSADVAIVAVEVALLDALSCHAMVPNSALVAVVTLGAISDVGVGAPRLRVTGVLRTRVLVVAIDLRAYTLTF